MKPATAQHLAHESADWWHRGIIDATTAARLATRYGARASFTAALAKWLGVFGVLLLGGGILSGVGLVSSSYSVTCALVFIASGGVWWGGVKFATSPTYRSPVLGAALVTTALIGTGGALGLVSMDVTSLTPPEILCAVGALGLATAYGLRLRWPLVLGLLCLFHAVGAWTDYAGDGAYVADIANPPHMAIIAAVAVILGQLHTSAEDRALTRYAGFGGLYTIFGLLYLNCALWFESLEADTNAQIWMLGFAGVALLELALGSWGRERRLTGFGIVFLAIALYTEFFVQLWAVTSAGWFFLAAGVIGAGAGGGLEALARKLGAAPGVGFGGLVVKSANGQMRAELAALVREKRLAPEAYRTLAALYPVTGGGDLVALGRWLLIFGVLSLAAGSVLLVGQYAGFTIKLAVIASGTATLALLAGGWALKRRALLWAGRSAELLGGLSLIGFTFALAILYSTGSDNWPAPLLIDLIILLPFAYALTNILLLALSVVLFFSWFGGVTGFDSDWGAYWFGMNYPLRFLAAGTLIALAGGLHLLVITPQRYRVFAKLWISSGLFLAEMAFWLLSLFGNFGDMDDFSYEPSTATLFGFNFAWVVANVALLLIGTRTRFRLITGYAVVFGLIQLYTLYFAHVAQDVGFVLSLFLAGFVSLALVIALERWRRARKLED